MSDHGFFFVAKLYVNNVSSVFHPRRPCPAAAVVSRVVRIQWTSPRPTFYSFLFLNLPFDRVPAVVRPVRGRHPDARPTVWESHGCRVFSPKTSFVIICIIFCLFTCVVLTRARLTLSPDESVYQGISVSAGFFFII